MTRAGLVRAEGNVVTTTAATSKIVVQQFNSNTNQYEPAQITVGDLLAGGGTGFTQNSVIFADATGSLAQDNANLNFNDSTNVLTVGSDVSSGGNLIASAAGKGLYVKEGSNARMGTATLTAGTVTIANTSVTANTRIFLNRYSINGSTALGLLSVGTVTASTSFVINALKEADATTQTNDVSIVHWILVEPAA